MENSIAKKLLYIFSVGLPLFTACQKSDSAKTTNLTNSNTVITNNYNISLSAANKNYDSVSVDVDNDKIKDFTIITYNSNYDSYKESYRTIEASYIYSLQDSTLIVVTNKYANDYWSRIYNFGGDSQFFNYAGGFSTGDVIGSKIPNAQAVADYTGTLTAFETVGNSWDCTSSYVYEAPQYAPDTYNESEGAFLNSTQYIGFTIKKADGRHYGWIKLSNSSSCLNIQVISSAYSTAPNQSVTTN